MRRWSKTESTYSRKHSAQTSGPFRAATMDPGIESIESWVVFLLEQSCCGRGSFFVAGSSWLHVALKSWFLGPLRNPSSYLIFSNNSLLFTLVL